MADDAAACTIQSIYRGTHARSTWSRVSNDRALSLKLWDIRVERLDASGRALPSPFVRFKIGGGGGEAATRPQPNEPNPWWRHDVLELPGVPHLPSVASGASVSLQLEVCDGPHDGSSAPSVLALHTVELLEPNGRRRLPLHTTADSLMHHRDSGCHISFQYGVSGSLGRAMLTSAVSHRFRTLSPQAAAQARSSKLARAVASDLELGMILVLGSSSLTEAFCSQLAAALGSKGAADSKGAVDSKGTVDSGEDGSSGGGGSGHTASERLGAGVLNATKVISSVMPMATRCKLMRTTLAAKRESWRFVVVHGFCQSRAELELFEQGTSNSKETGASIRKAANEVRVMLAFDLPESARHEDGLKDGLSPSQGTAQASTSDEGRRAAADHLADAEHLLAASEPPAAAPPSYIAPARLALMPTAGAEGAKTVSARQKLQRSTLSVRMMNRLVTASHRHGRSLAGDGGQAAQAAAVGGRERD